MKELFVAKAATPYAAKVGGGTISGYNELDLLEIGALAIFTEGGTLVTAATLPAAIATQKQFYVCVGEVTADGTNRTKRSRMIDRSAFHRTYCPYAAPVKHQIYVGYNGASGSLNLPGTLVPGTTAFLSVGIEYEGQEPHVNWGRYEYRVLPGDTDTDVVNGLVNAVNADNSYYAKWTAAVIGVSPNLGISITADEFGSKVISAVDGIIQQATRGTLTDIDYGKGTPLQVRAYEDLQNIENGDTNRVEHTSKYWKKPSQVDLAAQYDTYTFEWSEEYRRGSGTEYGYTKEAIIAIPDGAQRATLDTILTTILLLAPSASNGSSNSVI